MHRILAALTVAASMLSASVVHAASKDEDALYAGCDWLERAIAREPERDDAFGMFMRGMRPKCQAMLEGLARRDNSVQAETVRQITKEIAELQSVIDAEHGGPPPERSGPSPAEVAKKTVEDEKAAENRIAEEKAAAERAAADKAAEDKAARERAEAERIAAEKAAEEARKEAEREAKRAEAADKAAAEEAKRAEAQEARERAAADKKAAEEEKKAAEEAKRAAEREARERAAADKKAAEEAKRAAARDAAERARAEEEAKRQAEALVAAEEEAERRAAAERKAAAERPMAMPQQTAPAPKAKRLSDKGLDGTWEQPEKKVLDRNVKRTLNLMTKGNDVDGELYEEVWFEAPTSWIDTSCGGNKTFRMVTTARVSGEIDGKTVELSREPPRILTCTCSSRCTVEKRRRGFELTVSASGMELNDSTGVFVRPGSVVVAATTDGHAPGQEMDAVDFTGNWETAPFSSRDRTIVQRLELSVDAAGALSGSFIEKVSQDLPLSSWADRFCDGADKWEWVAQWKVAGKIDGRKGAVKATDGSNILCSCPSKCRDPKDKLVFDLVYGVTGVTLHVGDRSFERR